MPSRALVVSSTVALLSLFVGAACSSSSKPSPVEEDSSVPSEAGSETGASEAGPSEAGPAEAAACKLSASLTLVGSQTPKLSAACTACTTAACCVQANACEATQDCAELDTCLAACSSLDSACALTCEGAHPTGLTAGKPFLDCELAFCNVECQNFACSVKWPAPKDPTVTFTFVPVDFETNKAIANATVKLCKTTDAACATPSATYTTNAKGEATVTAPTAPSGIDGYLEITASGEMTTLDFVGLVNGNADIAATGAVITAPVLSTSTWMAATAAAGITPDPTKGYVTFIAEDCVGSAAQGVKVATTPSDSSTKTVYIAGAVPSGTATSTDPSGEGAIVNIPPGAGTITATDAAGKKFSSLGVVFRAGAVTGVSLVVTP